MKTITTLVFKDNETYGSDNYSFNFEASFYGIRGVKIIDKNVAKSDYDDRSKIEVFYPLTEIQSVTTVDFK